ncbi:MAG TPA: FAD-dependent oxidoreductase [Thermomicrobiales bacterium]|nr:FAD-dependent oxidoreductase [Thermomicrobiales bacterium]
MGRTVIIGAGVIGLCTAWELQKRGHEVLVIDRTGPAAGSSFGNAGWVVRGYATPVPAPGIVAQSIKWMLRSDSPLYIKPRLDPRFALWMIDFWRHCSADAFRDNMRALSALNAKTMEQFDALAGDGVSFEMHREGMFILGLSREMVAAEAELLRGMEEFGLDPVRVLYGQEVFDAEPGLSKRVAGAVAIDGERHVKPDTFVAGLVEALTERGIEIRSGVDVYGSARRNGRVTTLRTTTGDIEANEVVVAAGAWSGPVTERVTGTHLPLEAGKGYSVTVDQETPAIRRTMNFIEARCACTPFSDSLRLAGTMELSGINLDIRPERVEALRKAGRTYLANWEGGATERVWVGMRSMTADGIPVMGRVPGSDNTWIAAGHAMLGVTLAPATGAVMAELMTTGASDIDTKPFSADRFSKLSRI